MGQITEVMLAKWQREVREQHRSVAPCLELGSLFCLCQLVVKQAKYPQASVREAWPCANLSYHKRQQKGPSGLSNIPETTRKIRSKLNG